MVTTRSKKKTYDPISGLKKVSFTGETPIDTTPYTIEGKGAAHE